MTADTGGAQPSIEGLRKIRLLQGLTDTELKKVASACVWTRHRAAPDVQIISREATDRDVYFVVAGRVRVGVFAQDYARQIIFRDLPAGEHFGDLAAIDGAARSANIFSIEETLLARLSPEAFKGLIDEYPDVRRNHLRALVRTIRDLSDRVFIDTLSVRKRLIAELLRLAEEAGIKNNRARIDPLPRQEYLASRIGTSRFQVSRELAELETEGLAFTEGRALDVPDVGRLRKAFDAPEERLPKKPI